MVVIKEAVRRKLVSPLSTVRGRILIAAILVEAVMLTVLIANGIRLLDASMTQQVNTFARQISPILSAAVVAPMLQSDHATVQAILDESQVADGLSYAAVSDANGRVVAVAGWPIDKPLPIVKEANAASERKKTDSPRQDIVQDIIFAGQKLGRLHFAIDLSNVVKARESLLFQGGVIATLEVLTSILTLGLLGVWLTRHLTQLAAASEEVARGRFDFPPVAEGEDEIGRLGVAFNAMLRAVRDRQDDMESLNAELRNLGIVAAHHLQEPVRPLVSYSKLLAKRYAPSDDPDAMEWAQYVYTAGGRLKALLRDFERYITLLSQTPQPERVSAEELARAAAKLALDQSDGVTLAIDAPPGLIVVVDRRMMIETISHLMENAWMHRGASERIMLTVAIEETPADVAFVVSDDGPGIPSHLHGRLVRPFEKGDGAQPTSTGFGLAFCAVVARAHGGMMEISSNNPGTIITITIPKESNPAATRGGNVS